jgi:hypothetical protein
LKYLFSEPLKYVQEYLLVCLLCWNGSPKIGLPEAYLINQNHEKPWYDGMGVHFGCCWCQDWNTKHNMIRQTLAAPWHCKWLGCSLCPASTKHG